MILIGALYNDLCFSLIYNTYNFTLIYMKVMNIVISVRFYLVCS